MTQSGSIFWQFQKLVAEYGCLLENHYHDLADAVACAWIAREIFKPKQL